MSNWIEKLLGPIFVKEMLEVSRRKRHYVIRSLYGAALLVACWSVWLDSRPWIHSSDRSPIQAMAQFAEYLFETVCILQYCAIYLFVPVTIAGLIAAEREANSLDLLFTTGLTDREIVFGKLASRLTVTALLLCGALPVLSLIALFGGFDGVILWRVTAVTLLSMLFTASHAIYFSVTTKTTVGAMVRTYWWLAVVLLIAPGILVFLVEEVLSYRGKLEHFLPLVNPLFLFGSALTGFEYDISVGKLGVWFFPLSFVAPALWSGLLLVLATARLRRSELRSSRLVERVASLRMIRDWWSPWSTARVERRRRRANRLLGRWPVENPLWLRARLTFVYDRGGYIRRIVWACWLLAIGIHVLVGANDYHDLCDEEFAMGFSAVVWIGISLLTVVVSANSLVSDRRRGFLELVWTTPLDAREIVDGSLLAVACHLRTALLLPWVLGVFYGCFGQSHSLGVACSLITATLFVATLGTLGVIGSLVSKRASAVVVSTIVFGVIVCIGLPFLVAVFEEAGAPVAGVLGGMSIGAAAIFRRRGWMLLAITCGFTGLHILLTGLATFWVGIDWVPGFDVVGAAIACVLGGLCIAAGTILRRRRWMLLAIACGFTGLDVVLRRLANSSVGFDWAPSLDAVIAAIACVLAGFCVAAGTILRRNGRMLLSSACRVTGFLIVLTGLVALLFGINAIDPIAPLLASNPLFWTIFPLTESTNRWGPDFGTGWFFALPFYWLALGANVLLARRWTIRHFDELIGRVPQRTSLPEPSRHVATG